MIRPRHIVVAAALLSASVSAMGEPLAYVCQVTHVYNLSDQGSLEISAWEKDMKGSSFTVSRLTGEVGTIPLTKQLGEHTFALSTRAKPRCRAI